MDPRTNTDNTDQGYSKFYERRLHVLKIDVALAFVIIMAILVGIIDYFLGTETTTCLPISSPLRSIPDAENAFLADIAESLCDETQRLFLFAYAWIGVFFLRILLYGIFKLEPVYRIEGLRLQDTKGQPLSLSKYTLLLFLEWLPFYLGVAYILLIGIHPTLFNLGVFTTAIILTQLIIVAFSLTSRLLDFEVIPTEKKRQKIQKEFEKKHRRWLADFGFYTRKSALLIILAFFGFSVIQIIRVPPLNVEFYPAIYANTEPVWHNNAYFAFQGLSAPEDVDDFYKYGRRLSIVRLGIYEELKKLSLLDTQYLHKVPDMGTEKTLALSEGDLTTDNSEWKNLACLYSLQENLSDCASFADLQTYIRSNQILWDRYNRIIELGYEYSAIPQTLGNSSQIFTDLGKLKAAHIIYLAQNDQQDQALEEWLAHMRLFRQMAVSRDDMVFKAGLVVRMQAHMDALDKLLYIAPELAEQYQAQLRSVLAINGNAFRQDQMLADDISFVEPFIYSGIGNVNAIRNDVFACVISFEAYGNLPYSDYFTPESGQTLCHLQINKSSMLEYPLFTPGTYVANLIYSLTLGGMLKGQDLIIQTKILELRMKLAGIGVALLAEGFNEKNVLERLRDKEHNPITSSPYDWDAEEGYIYFERPDSQRRYTFHVNDQK